MADDTRPLSIVFEEDMPLERIAEFIQLLSEFYGEELDVVSAHDHTPIPDKIRKAS